MSKVTAYPMYGNDRYGCCVWASMGHCVQTWTANASTEQVLPEKVILDGYAAVTGFRPADPGTDRGTVMQDGLDYWRRNGLAGHRVFVFASVDHTDLGEVRAAIDLFGSVLMGIDVTQHAMQQFARREPWDASPNAGTPIGGHAIHAGRYDDTGFQVASWGRLQRMTTAFAERYLEEAWVVITPEWLSAAGTSPSGLDLYGLGEDYAALTGSANPFPRPATGGTVDAQLAAALRRNGWVDKPHAGTPGRVADAARAWLKEKSL